MLVHSCLFVLLSLMSHIIYIYTVLFEQINDDDDSFKGDVSEVAGVRLQMENANLGTRFYAVKCVTCGIDGWAVSLAVQCL